MEDIVNELRKRPFSEPDRKNDLARLEKWLVEYQEGGWQKVEARAFDKWVPQVVQYSYRIEEA